MRSYKTFSDRSTVQPQLRDSDIGKNLFYFLLVLYVILRSGVVLIIVSSSLFNLVDIGLVVVLGIYVLVREIRIPIYPVFVLLILFLWIVAVEVVHFDSGYSSYLAWIIRLCLTFLIVQVVPRTKFMNYLVGIILFLAATSLVFFFLQPFLYNFYVSAPTLVNAGTAYYHNLWIWLSNYQAPDRNFGVFFEPGAYQLFLNLALLFVMTNHHMKNRVKIFSAAILTITVYTTYSTTGYIAMILVYATAVSATMKRMTGRNFIVFVFGVLLTGAAFVTFVLNNDVIVSKFSVGQLNYRSFQTRSTTLSLETEIIKNNPIFGVGIDDFELERIDAGSQIGAYTEGRSNTYTSIGAMFGALILGFYAFQHLRFAWKLRSNLFFFSVHCVADRDHLFFREYVQLSNRPSAVLVWGGAG